MLWFEPIFEKILKHEFDGSMNFDTAARLRLPKAPDKPCQLYIHVPFCETLCPFCSFHRVQHREHKAKPYFDALRAELQLYHDQGFRFSDIYVGGGTPTVAPDELVRTLELARSLWPIRAISVETNPDHLREDVYAALQSVGVHRLSVGVQSFDDALLKQMDRYDRYGSGTAIAERLADAAGRFPTINVDMIFNLPNQTLDMLDRDLQRLLDVRIDQASFYPLMTAPIARRRMEKSLGHDQPERRQVFYQHIVDAMAADYVPSSAWCFTRKADASDAARPHMIDEFIIDHTDYVGVGSGAFSYVDGWMYSTTFSINQYRELLAHGHSGITQSKRLSLRERMRYDYLVQLFGLKLSRAEMRRKYGRAFWLMLAPELASMRALGATRYDRATDSIVLTDRGMYCWVLMMSAFFNAVNAFRDQMRRHIRAELDLWQQADPQLAKAEPVPVKVALPAPAGR